MAEWTEDAQGSRDKRVGKTLGAYKIVAVLGQGGTGTVYDALRLPGEDPVALKLIHTVLAGDKQIRGRFEREAAILRRLEGPHVCPIVDFGEAADPEDPRVMLLYLALGRVDGPSLETMLRTDGSVPLERALEIMLEVLAALKTAHARSIIHRDLKPANILLKHKMHVFVVDFGLAKIVSGGTGTTGLTSANMVFGTPEYMSPEQARGDEPDARSDVYSAGMILYEMCAGDVPFSGGTPLKVLTRQLTESPVPPRLRAPDRGISAALEAVIMHALAKEPDDRYGSVAAFSAALLHARALPDDTASVRPAAFAESPEDADAFAKTIPAISNNPSYRPPSIRIRDDASEPAPPGSNRPTPVASAPPLRDRRWLAIWVTLALASVAGGIYFALKP